LLRTSAVCTFCTKSTAFIVPCHPASVKNISTAGCPYLTREMVKNSFRFYENFMKFDPPPGRRRAGFFSFVCTFAGELIDFFKKSN
jgi:hypothetical protein